VDGVGVGAVDDGGAAGRQEAERVGRHGVLPDLLQALQIPTDTKGCF
jgi:hypothetical protein